MESSSGEWRSAIGWAAQFLEDKRGVSAAVLAIALPPLIGFAALGTETGAWYTIKLQQQSAADSAALAAAYQVVGAQTNVIEELTPAASEAARRNGYRGSTPTVVYPYSDNAVARGIAVYLRQTQGALLGAMFLPDVTIATKAVAVIELLNNACVLALGTSGTVVEIADFARLNMPDCSVAANSVGSGAIALKGDTSSVVATTLVTAGEISFQGNPIDPAAPPSAFTLASRPMIGAPRISDPYADTLTHNFLSTGMPIAGGCHSHKSGPVDVYDGNCVVKGTKLRQSDILLSANTQISGSWNIATGQTIDLSPGTYWVAGDLTIETNGTLKCSSCSNVRGAGVTLILIGHNGTVGALTTAVDATINLNAPSSGLFAGLVIIQDSHGLPAGTTYSSTRSALTIGPVAMVNGLVYFPNASMAFHGKPSGAGPKCLVLVVNNLTVDKDSSLDTAGCGNAGLGNLPAVETVALLQ